MSGMIFDIQRCGLHDGPGIRTTVFFKGCPLSCVWCHNPESQAAHAQAALFSDRCTLCGRCEKVCSRGAHQIGETHIFSKDKCVFCGECVSACPAQAVKIYGEKITAQEIIDIVKKDIAYYQKSGGGITVSGGEPMTQPDFLKELLTLAKGEGIHTCVETSGFVKQDILAEISPLVDLFLYDYKATGEDEHVRLTGVNHDLILKNLEYLYKAGKEIVLRCPMIFGYNDTDEHLSAIAEFEKIMPDLSGIEILPYHNLGIGKAKAIGADCIALDNPDNDVKERLKQRLCDAGCTKAVIV